MFVFAGLLTDNNLCSLQIAKLKQQLQQRSKLAVSGGHDKDRQCGYPQGSCSLGTTQVLHIISTHKQTALLVSCMHVCICPGKAGETTDLSLNLFFKSVIGFIKVNK